MLNLYNFIVTYPQTDINRVKPLDVACYALWYYEGRCYRTDIELQCADLSAAVSSVGVSVAGTSSPRRVAAPLVQLAPALAHKPLAHPPVVVAQSHTIHHVAPNKLKVTSRVPPSLFFVSIALHTTKVPIGGLVQEGVLY